MSDELAAQVRELQEMMKNIMEERVHHGVQGRPSVGPDGGAQDAVPPRPAVASSGHMPAPGTFIISQTRTTLPPKYDGIDMVKICAVKEGILIVSL